MFLAENPPIMAFHLGAKILTILSAENGCHLLRRYILESILIRVDPYITNNVIDAIILQVQFLLN